MRSTIFAAAIALATFVAVPATAMAGDKHDAGNFPMPAATFKQKVDARQAKAREHMEKRAATLDGERAKELRSKFEAGVAKINAEVGKATADGTVTKEEAEAVRKIAREARGGHRNHARHAKHHKK